MDKSMDKSSRLKHFRISSQALVFFIFCSSILLVESDHWLLPPKLFFFLDPMVTVVTMATTGVLVSGMILSGIMVLLTLIFGRFFCGWICPLGTLIDFTEWAFNKKPAPKDRERDLKNFAQVKFGILLFVIAASVVSVQWVFLFDPMVIMTRFVGVVMVPAERILFKGTPFSVLHAEQFILLVIVILLFSMIASRFWCRFICPLGAIYGLLARFSIFDFSVDDCRGCPQCRKSCPTHAIVNQKDGTLRSSECIRCFNCLNTCPTLDRSFGIRTAKPMTDPSIQMHRRRFLAWLSTGLAGSVVLSSHTQARPRIKELLRPPFAADEETFLDLCIRCQACVNVCPTNALQPQLMQSGLYGLWSPGLVPVSGACKTNCNRCSQVCPTGAIGVFDLQTKYTVKTGTAHLNKSRCVSWADNKPCGKCIPECPTGAITFYEDKNQQHIPVNIDFLLCVGCGICENVCHKQTPGPSALKVTTRGRNQVSGVDINTVLKHLKEKKGTP